MAPSLPPPTAAWLARARDRIASLLTDSQRSNQIGDGGGLAPARRRTFHSHFRDAQGRSGRFHAYGRHIDPSRPVGVVFYLDGDYWFRAQSHFHRPRGMTMLRLAAVANARNLVLVAVDTPDPSWSKDGRTWWVSAEHNGAWFRAFAEHLVRRLGIDPDLGWAMGYSGGAEFIASELLGHPLGSSERAWSDELLRGGVVLVGGGGTAAGPSGPAGKNNALPLSWWVGERDGDPDGTGPCWSARCAAQQGRGAFHRAGWTGTTLDLLPGTGHRQYDLPLILRTALDRAGLQPRHRV